MSTVPHPRQPASPPDELRIVLIEDSGDYARLVQELLLDTLSNGFEVTHFSRLDDAIQSLADEPADCALLDLALPDSEGLDSLRRLQEATPDLPVVVLSGLDDEALAVQAVQAGAQDYVVKARADGPLLTRSIRYAIERRRGERERAQLMLERAARAEAEAVAETVGQLQRLTEAALAPDGLEALLSAVLDTIRDMLGVDTAAVLLLEQEGNELVATVAKGLEEEVEEGVRVPVGHGFAGTVFAERRPIVVEDLATAEVVNPLLYKKGLTTLLGVPLTVERGPIGVLHVGSKTPRAWTREDTSLLELAADRVAVVLERARLHEQEHEIAVTLQRALLPERLPQLAGVEVAARYTPGAVGTEIGGDWYDVIPLPDGRLGLAMGDVVGRGIPAASLMGQLRNAVRAYAMDGYPPAELIERLDRLTQALTPGRMATFLYGVLSEDGSELAFSSAGHLPPLVADEGGARLLEGARSVPLGVLPYSSFSEISTELRPGSTVLLYTDGLVEERGVPIESRLDDLRALVGDAPQARPDELCDRLVSELLPVPARDDVAVLAVRVTPLAPDRLSMTLPAEPEALAGARRALRRWLAHAGASEDAIYDIILACGEAWTNAIEHAYLPGEAVFDVHASKIGDELVISVRDYGRWRAPRGTDRGRGLQLMETLMDAVEVHKRDDGTTVELRRRL